MEILDPTESEREIYADLRAILKLAHENQELAAAISDLSEELEKTLIEPLFEINNFGVDVPNNGRPSTMVLALEMTYKLEQQSRIKHLC